MEELYPDFNVGDKTQFKKSVNTVWGKIDVGMQGRITNLHKKSRFVRVFVPDIMTAVHIKVYELPKYLEVVKEETE